MFSIDLLLLDTEMVCNSHGQLSAQAGFWQIMTGISIGCAVSSKWTGILMIPVIWVSILHDGWNKLCERHNSVKSIVRNLFAHTLSTMLLPLCVYLAIFQVHFNLIPNAGDHDLLVSSHLKYSLKGNSLEPSQPSMYCAHPPTHTNIFALKQTNRPCY